VAVKHWLSPNDVNNKNRHAQVEGSDIEFFAFPYQQYHGKKGEFSCLIGSSYGWDSAGNAGTVWSASLYQAEKAVDAYTGVYYTGRSTPIDQKKFLNDKDACFEWADRQLRLKNGEIFDSPKEG
jgi:hypothetical protein